MKKDTIYKVYLNDDKEFIPPIKLNFPVDSLFEKGDYYIADDEMWVIVDYDDIIEDGIRTRKYYLEKDINYSMKGVIYYD